MVSPPLPLALAPNPKSPTKAVHSQGNVNMGKIAIPQFVGDAGETDTSSQSRAKKEPA
jgi:hypothetical protein